MHVYFFNRVDQTSASPMKDPDYSTTMREKLLELSGWQDSEIDKFLKDKGRNLKVSVRCLKVSGTAYLGGKFSCRKGVKYGNFSTLKVLYLQHLYFSFHSVFLRPVHRYIVPSFPHVCTGFPPSSQKFSLLTNCVCGFNQGTKQPFNL